MHGNIEQDQAELETSQTPKICPHKNCLAHLEFLNDEVRYRMLETSADTDSCAGSKIASKNACSKPELHMFSSRM